MNRIAIFDMDGTLADSLGGIAESVNRTREHLGYARLPEEEIRHYTGDGSHKLLERSFADVKLKIPPEEAHELMLHYYESDPVYHTWLYPGVLEGLQTLHGAGIRLFIFSNKHARVGRLIADQLGLSPYFQEIIGGDSGMPLKPSPDVIHHLRRKYQAEADGTWMVGDNHTDIACAQRAGVHSVFCQYGFGTQEETSPDYSVRSFAELIPIILPASVRPK